ncbi:putative phage-related protein (plasmid) [Erwinia amylovora ATCC 49946]|nr:putative phage-related protein [Erwinia amylovora ATCC 49946]
METITSGTAAPYPPHPEGRGITVNRERWRPRRPAQRPAARKTLRLSAGRTARLACGPRAVRLLVNCMGDFISRTSN